MSYAIAIQIKQQFGIKHAAKYMRECGDPLGYALLSLVDSDHLEHVDYLVWFDKCSRHGLPNRFSSSY